jgi:hypothetical protein
MTPQIRVTTLEKAGAVKQEENEPSSRTISIDGVNM